MAFEMSNMEFSKKDRVFIEACKHAEIPVTSRQASKYRRRVGLAYNFRSYAIGEMEKPAEPIKVEELPLGEGITLQEAEATAKNNLFKAEGRRKEAVAVEAREKGITLEEAADQLAALIEKEGEVKQ